MACSAKDNTKNQDVVVMSFNMRYDNPNDGDNRWNNRKEIVAQTITDAQTDIVGTLELLHRAYDLNYKDRQPSLCKSHATG